MPAPSVLKRPATYEDLLQVPDHMVAEILDGDLFASPRPSPRHSHAASGTAYQIGSPFHFGRGGPGGWLILSEPELHLQRDVVVPDLAGWRRERLPTVPDTAWISLAPDWVCEVISPSTEALDRGRKLAIYARERVGHAWLINPASETLEIFALENDRWTLVTTHVGAVCVRADPFAAIELDLSLLWPPA